MFTGLIEELSTLLHLTQDPSTHQTIFTLAAHIVLQGIALGDSIAVNGVCLTVTHFDLGKHTFTVGLSPETLRRTNFGELKVGGKRDGDMKHDSEMVLLIGWV